MKKLIYLVIMVATFGLVTSCEDKKKDDDLEDEIDDVTYVLPVEAPFIA